MKWESHQLRQTSNGNYVAPCYFLLVLTKCTFSDSKWVGGSHKQFWVPCNIWCILPLLKNGPLRIWCTGKGEMTQAASVHTGCSEYRREKYRHEKYRREKYRRDTSRHEKYRHKSEKHSSSAVSPGLQGFGCSDTHIQTQPRGDAASTCAQAGLWGSSTP